jgi:hypothetical protein
VRARGPRLGGVVFGHPPFPWGWGDGETVRQFTCRGYDWTDRYPAIARGAAKLARWLGGGVRVGR